MRLRIVTTALRGKQSTREFRDSFGIDQSVCKIQQVLCETPYLQYWRSSRALTLSKAHREKRYKFTDTILHCRHLAWSRVVFNDKRSFISTHLTDLAPTRKLYASDQTCFLNVNKVVYWPWFGLRLTTLVASQWWVSKGSITWGTPKICLKTRCYRKPKDYLGTGELSRTTSQASAAWKHISTARRKLFPRASMA